MITGSFKIRNLVSEENVFDSAVCSVGIGSWNRSRKQLYRIQMTGQTSKRSALKTGFKKGAQ